MMVTHSQFRSRPRLGAVLILIGVALVSLVSSPIPSLGQADDTLMEPEEVLQAYLTVLYARDYEAAYQYVSAADKAFKSREDYLGQNIPFSGFTLDVTRKLSSYISYSVVDIEEHEGRIIIDMGFVLPNGNAEAVQEILFDPRGDELSLDQRRGLLEKLDRLWQNGEIPTLEGEHTFELVKDDDGWRVFENWAEAIRVHFSGVVKDGLSWEFEPLKELVLAKPGETLKVVYRAKNISDHAITAKARHIDRPEEYLKFFYLIQCFCFFEQTLEPGEEIEMPLVFRLKWDVPDEVEDFYVHYEFFPIESFPQMAR